MTPSRLAAFAISLILAFSVCVPASAQTPRSYRVGKDAAEAGDWPRVEKEMRAAITENSEAKRRILGRYTPYYFLGVALAEQGDCRSALTAWQQTDRYGALREGGDEEIDLKKRRQRCLKIVADVKNVAATTLDSIEAAGEAAESLQRLKNHEILAPLWNTGEPSFASRSASASKVLSEARANLEKGKAQLDLNLLAESGYQAVEAMRAFEATKLDAEAQQAQRAAVNQAVSGAMSVLDQAEKEARAILRRARRIAPYPKRLGAQVSKLRRVVAKIDATRDSASAAELAALADELKAESAALRPLAAGPPASLKDAAAAYLANDFQGVIDLLAERSFSRGKSRFHAGLLQAAALFGLYITGGEAEPDLLERCRSMLSEVVLMDASYGAPGERFFPPGFRDLFEAARHPDSEDSSEQEDSSDNAASDALSGGF